MATLADELANDFLDDGSDVDVENDDVPDPETEGFSMPPPKRSRIDGTSEEAGDDEDKSGEDEDMGGVGLLGEAEEETEARMEAERRRRAPKGMSSVARFMKELDHILEEINYYRSLQDNPGTTTVGTRTDFGRVEDNPEYKLLVKTNEFSTEIDDHKLEVLKYIKDHYSTRFPELETLLADPLEYTYAVAAIGNGPLENIKDLIASSDNPMGQPLDKLIARQRLLTVIVEATNTRGQALPEQEIAGVKDACEKMLKLERARRTLIDFVESRMNLFAPNLTRLLGSRTAAQLLVARGGLSNLANTPDRNIPAIGSKRSVAGLATNTGVRAQGQGYLYESELIRGFRPELRTQAMRVVSAKIVLAARVDKVHESPDGSAGDDLLEQCQKRLDKLTEPPPNRGHKALPAPNEAPSKKRGGRRARKAKEATAMTDLRKAQNRMAFGKEEQEVGYGTGEGTVGLGMIGQSNDGRVRALQVDQRTRAKLSKKNPGWGGATPAPGGGSGLQSSLRGFGQGAGAGNATVLKGHGLRTSGVGGLATSLGGAGTASSLNFGVKSGLELVDPKVRAALERKNQADQDRWFKGGTFTQVGGGASVVPAKPAAADGGFKVPSLPVKRKADDA